MAEPFSELIQRVRQDWPGFTLVINEQWNSGVANHRFQIRTVLCDSLSSSGEEKVDQWLDLDLRPQPKKFSVSIAHCPTAGGFAQIKRPARVGLDLEDPTRDFSKAVARISTVDELTVAPSHCALWVAKEALLKAYELPLISDARVNSWKTLGNSMWFFSTTQKGHGFIQANSRVILGLFIIPA